LPITSTIEVGIKEEVLCDNSRFVPVVLLLLLAVVANCVSVLVAAVGARSDITGATASDPNAAKQKINAHRPAKRINCGFHSLYGSAVIERAATMATSVILIGVETLAMRTKTPMIQICFASAEIEWRNVAGSGT
jgi:hypothetical protein